MHNVVQPMELAPLDDGWYLLYEADNRESTSPWIIGSRCDDGWIDAGGSGVEPVGWVSLPEPQPKGTGWKPAQGHVEIAAGEIGGKVFFIATVVKPDGSQDCTRDAYIDSYETDVRTYAITWAKTLNLPLIDKIESKRDTPLTSKDGCAGAGIGGLSDGG